MGFITVTSGVRPPEDIGVESHDFLGALAKRPTIGADLEVEHAIRREISGVRK